MKRTSFKTHLGMGKGKREVKEGTSSDCQRWVRPWTGEAEGVKSRLSITRVGRVYRFTGLMKSVAEEMKAAEME